MERSGPAFIGRNQAVSEPCVMKFVCRISEQKGVCTVEHASPDVGPIRVIGSTRDEALRKMEEEIRYWLEICPCSGQAFRNLQIELTCEGST
jgi:hypothetical protein